MGSSSYTSGGYPTCSDLTTTGALMHLMRSNLGVTVLSMAWAVSQTGILVGPVLTIMLVLISSSSMYGLVECARWHARKVGFDHLDYGDLAFYSVHSSSCQIIRPFAKACRLVVNLSVIVLQLSFCCMYYVVIAQSLRQIVIEYWPEIPEDRAIIAVLWVPLTITTFSRKLSGFYWISAIGNLLYILSVALILKYAWAHLHSITEYPIAASLEKLPAFLTTTATCVEGVSTVLPLENSMKSKELFIRVLCIAFTVVAVFMIVIGISGYLAFGSSICANITLNLPLYDGYSDVAKVSLVLVLFCTFPIQFFIPVEILWPMIEEKIQTSNIYLELGFKAAMSAIPCLLSISLPFVDNIIELAGSLLSAPLQFIYPSIIMLLTWSQQNQSDARFAASSDITGEGADYDSAQPYSLSRIRGFKRFLRAGSTIIALFLGVATVIFGMISTISSIQRNYDQSTASSTCRGGANFSEYHRPYVRNSTILSRHNLSV